MSNPYSNTEKRKNHLAFMREHVRDLANYLIQLFQKLDLEESAKLAHVLNNEDAEKYRHIEKAPNPAAAKQRNATSAIRAKVDELTNSINSIVNNARVVLQTAAQNIMNRNGTPAAHRKPILKAIAQATQNTVPTLVGMLPTSHTPGGRPQINRPASRVTHQAFRPRLDQMFQGLQERLDAIHTGTASDSDHQELFRGLNQYAHTHNIAESIFDQAAGLSDTERDALFKSAANVAFDPEYQQQLDAVMTRPLQQAVGNFLSGQHSPRLFSGSPQITSLLNAIDTNASPSSPSMKM